MLRGNRLVAATIILASSGRSLEERALADEAARKSPIATNMKIGFTGKEKAQWKQEKARFKR